MKKNTSGFILMECLIAFSLVSTLFFSLMLYQIKNTIHAESILYELIASTQLDNALEVLQKKSTNTDCNNHLLPRMQCHVTQLSLHQCLIDITWFYRQSFHRQLTGYC